MWCSNSNTCCSNTKDLQASFFLVDTVETFVSQKMGISHLAAAVFLVYLSAKYSMIGRSLHMWCFNSNTCCLHIKDLQASFFQENTVEASVSQKMRISHLAAAVLVVYLSSEYSMIVGVCICDAPIQIHAVQTLKTYRPHSFWWIQWRPLSLRKWESAI